MKNNGDDNNTGESTSKQSQQSKAPQRFTIPSFQSSLNKNKNTVENSSVPDLFNERKRKESQKQTERESISQQRRKGSSESWNINNIDSNTVKNNNVPPPIRVRSSDGRAMVDGGIGPPILYKPGITPIENIMSSHIGVNKRQQGNPILKHIKHSPTTFIDMVPDYLLGPYTCALFISVRYHLLFPNYLIRRIRELKSDFRLRIILCLVDIEDSESPLLEINRLGIVHECTLLLAWSVEEAARYLETFKVYEKKGPASIMERIDTDIVSRTSDVLTTIRSVNKTDVKTLISTFGSMKSIVNTPLEQLKECPGFGDKKVKRLYEAFHNPFYSNKRSKSSRQKKNKKLEKKNCEDITDNTHDLGNNIRNDHEGRRSFDGDEKIPKPLEDSKVRDEFDEDFLTDLINQEEELDKEEKDAEQYLMEGPESRKTTTKGTDRDHFESFTGENENTNSHVRGGSRDYTSDDDDFIDETLLLELDKIEEGGQI